MDYELKNDEVETRQTKLEEREDQDMRRTEVESAQKERPQLNHAGDYSFEKVMKSAIGFQAGTKPDHIKINPNTITLGGDVIAELETLYATANGSLVKGVSIEVDLAKNAIRIQNDKDGFKIYQAPKDKHGTARRPNALKRLNLVTGSYKPVGQGVFVLEAK